MNAPGPSQQAFPARLPAGPVTVARPTTHDDGVAIRCRLFDYASSSSSSSPAMPRSTARARTRSRARAVPDGWHRGSSPRRADHATDELVPGGEHADDGLAMDDDGALTECCEHAEVRGVNRRAAEKTSLLQRRPRRESGRSSRRNGLGITTRPAPRSCASSWMQTASAPYGIGAPVMIRVAWPARARQGPRPPWSNRRRRASRPRRCVRDRSA